MAVNRRAVRVTAAGRGLCVAGATLGALGLLGWAVGWPALYTLAPDQPPMVPNACAALMVLGIAALARMNHEATGATQRLAILAAALVATLGVVTLAEYAFRTDLGIDRLLFRTSLGAYPARASPPTALALVGLGTAIALFDLRPDRTRRPVEWLLIAVALVSLVGLAGQMLGAGIEYGEPTRPVPAMAIPAAIGLLSVSIGLLLADPRDGIAGIALSDGPGGMLLRRMALPVAALPLVFGFGIARLFDILNGRYPLILASIAVALTAAGLAIFVVTARLLDQSHAELEASRTRTRELFTHAPDGIFIADDAGRFTEVNAAACRLLGVSESEIVGKRMRDITAPVDARRLPAGLPQLREGELERTESRLRHRDGKYVPVEMSTTVLPGKRRQTVVRDITERKAAEEEVSRSKAKIEGIISIASDAIVSIDESQRITMFNRGAEQLFGWSEAEAMGQPLDMLIPERFRDAHRMHIRQFADEPTTSRRMGERLMAVLGLRKDGSEFTAEAAISKFRLGNELTFTAVVRDVTHERRRAEQDSVLSAIGLLLASSLERTQVIRQAAKLLVERVADGCAIDLVDDPESVHPTMTRTAAAARDPAKRPLAGEFEKAGPGWRSELLRMHSPEARKTIRVSHVTDEYLDSIAKSPEHRRLLAALEPESIITVALQARGLMLGVLALVSSDKNRRFDESDVAFAEEVAQRLALAIDNARLFETTKEAITTRDDILRVVAHDLRNPLGTILMRTSMLQLPDVHREADLRKHAVAIETAAKRMNRLIQDLLDVTRFEAGRLSVDKHPISARALVNDVASAQSGLADQARIRLHVDAPSDLPDVDADRDRLLQVFENLVANALKLTPAGGQIVVGAQNDGNEVTFSVRDTGVGIPADELPHVFDRFWQGRHHKEGAGLGLPIVKAFVEAHGGRVWVESTPGRGSTFSFTIPVASSATVAQPSNRKAS